MSKFVVNDLDRAVMALCRKKGVMPDFYRAISQGDIFFLMRYHPEIEGQKLGLKNGDKLPFQVIRQEVGECALLYSSVDRAQEYLRAAKKSDRELIAASMPSLQALEILGGCGRHAIINFGCSTGSITIPPDMMRDLASGKVFKPHSVGKPGENVQRRGFSLLDPAEYPTDIVQAAFEVMRRFANFRAAWIFGLPPEPPGEKKTYALMVLMDPRDEVIFHELNMAAQAATGQVVELDIGFALEDNPAYIASMFAAARPFYVAADYVPPVAPPAGQDSPGG